MQYKRWGLQQCWRRTQQPSIGHNHCHRTNSHYPLNCTMSLTGQFVSCLSCKFSTFEPHIVFLCSVQNTLCLVINPKHKFVLFIYWTHSIKCKHLGCYNVLNYLYNKGCQFYNYMLYTIWPTARERLSKDKLILQWNPLVDCLLFCFYWNSLMWVGSVLVGKFPWPSLKKQELKGETKCMFVFSNFVVYIALQNMTTVYESV